MSDASPASKQPNQEKLRKYLTFMLNASPQAESERIVSKRMKALRLEATATPEAKAAQKTQENLQHTLTFLEEIRNSVWKRSPQELETALAKVDTSAYPHLEPMVDRLRTIVRSRPQLTQATEMLQANDSIDEDFLKVFKQVLSAQPQERSDLRERAVVAFSNRTLRKRGRKTLKILEQVTPELYALEADWIDRMSKQRPKFFSEKPQGEDFYISPRASTADSGTSWWVWILLIIFVRMVLRWMANS